jgi:ParB-like chromosome segregation protein Spo0J
VTDYTNRIIGHGTANLDEILFNPGNWRIHPKAQQEALAGVLSEVGWVQSVIINQRTGRLVDGHLRCQVAARNGDKTIPVVYVDLDEAEEALVLASIDPLAAMAATDKAKLDDLLKQVQSDDERVQQMLADMAEREGLGELSGLDLDDDGNKEQEQAHNLISCPKCGFQFEGK